MSDPADIVALLRRSVELLAGINEPAAALVAAALRRWHDGESLESALGLPTDWRQRERIAKRDRALQELVRLNPGVETQVLADRISVGVARAARTRGVRPGGARGLFRDLLDAGGMLGSKQLGRLIAESRGHCKISDVREAGTGSAPRRNDGTPETDQD